MMTYMYIKVNTEKNLVQILGIIVEKPRSTIEKKTFILLGSMIHFRNKLPKRAAIPHLRPNMPAIKGMKPQSK